MVARVGGAGALFLCSFLAAVSLAWADTNDAAYRAIRDDDGIVSWEGPAQAGHLPAYRSRVVIAAPLWEIVAVLEDVDRACEWTAHCIEMRKMRALGPFAMLVYARMDAPWPVHDREVVTRIDVVFGSPGEVTVRIASTPAPELAQRAGVVRMPRLVGSYRFRMQGDRTEVQYDVSIDPGGALPEWLKRMVARDFPHQTLGRLRARVLEMRANGTYAARSHRLSALARASGFTDPRLELVEARR